MKPIILKPASDGRELLPEDKKLLRIEMILAAMSKISYEHWVRRTKRRAKMGGGR